MTPYTHVQFIGYAIPTIPADVTNIGDPNTPGFVEGRYIGLDRATEDISARIAVTMSAIDQARATDNIDGQASTLKIFLMPEFAFRGNRGAYSDEPNLDYFSRFCTEFAERVSDPKYEDWLFVFGTILNTHPDVRRGENPNLDRKVRVREDLAIALANAWQYTDQNNDPQMASFVTAALDMFTKYCHNDPVYEIWDRAYVLAGGAKDPNYPDGLSIQKKFISNEDFVLNFYKNSFSEECGSFPTFDETNGENKQTAFDDYGIFTIKGIRFGVEICLDHYDARLRQFRVPDTQVVQIQLIPSCGMQIMQGSVIACGNGGLVFNCDGQYGGAIDSTSQPGAEDSIWTDTASGKSHTHLAQVTTACIGNDCKVDPPALAKPDATVTRVPVQADTSSLFAYGSGELHIYTSLPVPPPVATS